MENSTVAHEGTPLFNFIKLFPTLSIDKRIFTEALIIISVTY